MEQINKFHEFLFVFIGRPEILANPRARIKDETTL